MKLKLGPAKKLKKMSKNGKDLIFFKCTGQEYSVVEGPDREGRFF